MRYVQCTFQIKDAGLREVFIALLSEEGYDIFEETDDTLLACIDEEQFTATVAKDIAGQYKVEYRTDTIEQQNWNATWEQSFEPVRVDDFCLIRADFHKPADGVAHEIIVTPKMSFGTGHHATTQLMIEQMRDMEVAGKVVLDFGSGTGVLAILAGMLGGSSITTIDNDEWAYENAIENTERNNATGIKVLQGSLEVVANEQYDIILANINRHILLQYMSAMYNQLNDDGRLLISGILIEDEPVLEQAAEAAGFKLLVKKSKNNWSSILFKKDRLQA